MFDVSLMVPLCSLLSLIWHLFPMFLASLGIRIAHKLVVKQFHGTTITAQ